ncbi:WD40 repeat domain-containing protein [Streptomyces collinus]|uniref:WD40 repeat domain-containing protein n=1 Tax=Streptomyces collinus TaxID=42684 RepID=UPI0036EA00ED
MKAEDVRVLLEQLAAAAATADGDAWRRSWTDLSGSLMDDGVLSDGAYAALPHLVEAAAALPPGLTVDFWTDLGFMVTADYRPDVPADLEAGFGAALRLAERAATRTLLATGFPGQVCAQLVLSCAALAGHHMGEMLWRVPEFPDHPSSELLLSCPACGSDTEIPDFSVDPVRPSIEAPPLPDPDPAAVREEGHPWSEAAEALREDALGKGWEPFLRVAREVAVRGVPPETPGQAVLCLVAGMVAVRGTPQQAAGELARRLMSLTGHFRCWDCERTWAIADGLAEPPKSLAGVPDGTLANPDGSAEIPGRPAEIPDGPLSPHRPAQARTAPNGSAGRVRSAAAGRLSPGATRFRQEENAVVAADGTPWGRVSVFSDTVPGSSAGVEALAVVPRPGRSTLVAGGGARGVVCLWDVTDGRPVHDPLPGHPDAIRSMTTVSLPEGRVLLASGGDSGTIAVWNPLTGRPVRQPAGDWPGGVTAMCTAALPDGRILLVTATPRGAVRMWEPDSGECVGRLNPYGSPIRSVTAVPLSADHTLIAASDTAGRVHLWDPAVDDPWDRGAAVQLSAHALAVADHRVAAVEAVLTPDRTTLATADDLGVVMLWDPATGAPVGDALPSSTGTAGPPLVTAATPHGGRTVVVTGTRHGHRLRVWEPETGVVRHIALDVSLTCLATVGAELIVGHDRGVLSLPLTGQ